MSEDFAVQLAGLRAGSLLAGYRLEARVGAGGMAVVFRARDERLGRLVALKVLAPGLATDPGFRRRFIAESRAAAAVDDPHIIPIYEAGEASGALFIAMRFVGGGDLRGILDREGALPPVRAVQFISPVASALDAAHAAGLVHRDVKPANILVDTRRDRPDHVYLSDFGVSKGAISSVSLTGTGHFLGTPAYAAPEQIQGLAVDGRADQYALACVAFQLLAGVPPFRRDQEMAVLFAHLSEPPPSVGSRRSGLPTAVDAVLARGMAKIPEKRFESCADFADALRRALGLAPYTSVIPVPGLLRPRPPRHTQSSSRRGPTAQRRGGPSTRCLTAPGPAAMPAPGECPQPVTVAQAALETAAAAGRRSRPGHHRRPRHHPGHHHPPQTRIRGFRDQRGDEGRLRRRWPRSAVLRLDQLAGQPELQSELRRRAADRHRRGPRDGYGVGTRRHRRRGDRCRRRPDIRPRRADRGELQHQLRQPALRAAYVLPAAP